MRTLICSDWHLGHYSSPLSSRLAQAFLERASEAGDQVILNGDIFEGLFEPATRAEAAHPDLAALIGTMIERGRLQRTEGNHDPGSGPPRLVLEHPALGRILVAHGHTVDPIRRSLPGRIGDEISRHWGRLRVVRGAARLAEIVATGFAGDGMEQVFMSRCREEVSRRGCALGVFGHIHRARLTAGDGYANAGALQDGRLEYLALSAEGAALGHLDLSELVPHAQPRSPCPAS